MGDTLAGALEEVRTAAEGAGALLQSESAVPMLLFGILLALIYPYLPRRRRQKKSARDNETVEPAGANLVRLDTSRPLPKRHGFMQNGPRNMTDPREQMLSVAAVSFETVPILNREEARLLPLLESVVRKHGNGHRVMAQTSLGEIVRPCESAGTWEDRKAAFASINSKRLDFVIINRWGHMVAAIEYQGSGHHHQDTAFLRDAVKREVVRKAGAEFIEVGTPYSEDEVRRRLVAVLSPGSAASTGTPAADAGLGRTSPSNS